MEASKLPASDIFSSLAAFYLPMSISVVTFNSQSGEAATSIGYHFENCHRLSSVGCVRFLSEHAVIVVYSRTFRGIVALNTHILHGVDCFKAIL
jgi:hypothetical protein